MHPVLLALLACAAIIAALTALYRLRGGSGTPGGDPALRRDAELRAELNRHPRGTLPRRW